MKLSIVVPVFNAEKYLNRCLSSIIVQTYKNLEIIIVNDGSKDKSAMICKSFSALDSRIILIEQENKGPAAARNRGIKATTGDYIGFVDADDYIEPDMYKTMIIIALKYSPHIIVSNFKIFNKENSYKVLRNELPYDALLSKEEIKEHFIKPYFVGELGIIPSLVNKIYKLDFLKKYGFQIDEKRIRAEDYWFNFNTFKYAESVFAIDVAYYHYYSIDGSVMKSFRPNQFEMFLKTRNELEEQNKLFKFQFDRIKENKSFINNTNEYILQAIRYKGVFNSYGFVKKILNNSVFRIEYSKYTPDKVHIKFIRDMLKLRIYLIVFSIYYLWSKKI